MLKQLTKRIYYLEGKEETDQPFLYYIKGDKKSLAIDAGNSEEHVRLFYKELDRKGLRKPDYTVLTHWHWDHTFGLHAVSGQTIASNQTNQKLREVMKWEWTEEKMRQREQMGEDIAFCNDCILKVYPNLSKIKVVQAQISVQNEMEVDLGGVHCKLMCHDSTHSRDALFIYLPEEKTLAVGDADCEDYYENGGNYDEGRLAQLIDYIEEIPFDRYLLGHEVPQKREEVLNYLKEELESVKRGNSYGF
ncbi:MAG: MBL fold metallo-hydrolase [bacterium]|nr:MBL fold metallo-hydrolase [bacterium]